MKELGRALAEWLDRDPFSLAIGAAGLACLVALIVFLVTGS
jgi:hypothetical protein